MAIFEDSEIEIIREICQMRPSELITLNALLTGLNDAQAEACRQDIRQWNRIRYGTAAVNGGTKGTKYDIEADRIFVTNKLRLRLDLPLLPGVLGSSDMGFFKMNIGGWSD